MTFGIELAGGTRVPVTPPAASLRCLDPLRWRSNYVNIFALFFDLAFLEISMTELGMFSRNRLKIA
jgi:hypothetical protein